MRNITNTLRSIGASDTTINWFFVAFIGVLFVGFITACIILVIEVLRGDPISASVIGIIATIVTIAGGLVIQSHTAVTIDGSNAKTAASTANALKPTIESTQQQNVEIVAQIVGLLQQAVAANASTPERVQAMNNNTAAMQANITATKENTEQLQQNKTC